MKKIIVFAIAMALLAACGKKQDSSFVDPRDEQKYRTVKIGNLVWMAQNLNFGTGSSHCLNDDSANCDKYGSLYTWHDAVEACPEGWKLPANEDWENLINEAGGSIAGKKLKAKTGWANKKNGTSGNGTDDFGFEALAGGYGSIDEMGDLAQSMGTGSYANWWTATKFGLSWFVQSESDDMQESDFSDSGETTSIYSVRCVQASAN
ncbi:MAG: hypothetical protein FWC26_00010 [Fibromonadales bacterium]|nr:hypothetical protein [Fibromonadales bacterium]